MRLKKHLAVASLVAAVLAPVANDAQAWWGGPWGGYPYYGGPWGGGPWGGYPGWGGGPWGGGPWGRGYGRGNARFKAGGGKPSNLSLGASGSCPLAGLAS